MGDREPITGRLREKLAEYEPQDTESVFTAHPIGAIGYSAMMELCDQIDAIHANLERENASLTAKYISANRSSIDYEHMVEGIEHDNAKLRKAIDEMKARDGETWLKGYGECHAELLEGNETLAADLEKCGWVRLPKDADGEYIRIGDVVTEHEDGHTFTVHGFMEWGGEWWVFQRDAIQAPAQRCTHYYAPTIEDVLREMLDSAFPNDFLHRVEAIDAMVAEYAPKLRLAGDAE